MAYCLDTSALIEAWVRRYPRDVFPRLWENLHNLAEQGDVVCPEEVLTELAAKDDDLHAWAKDHREMFVPLDEEQMTTTTSILGDFPRLVGEMAGRNRADPFVIALARVRELVVVTEERGGTPDRPRIPNVCEHYGISWINTLGWIRQMGWTF